MGVTTISVLLGVIGGLAVLALSVALYTLVVHQRIPALRSLERRTDELSMDVADLVERFTHYTRREASRTARAKRNGEPVGTDPGGLAAAPTDPRQIKAALRRQLFGRQ